MSFEWRLLAVKMEMDSFKRGIVACDWFGRHVCIFGFFWLFLVSGDTY